MLDALLGIITGLAILTLGIIGSRRANKRQAELAISGGTEDSDDGGSDGDGGGDGGD